MELKYTLVDACYKHIKGNTDIDSLPKQKKLKVKVVKQEKFAFQLLLNPSEDALCIIDNQPYIHWKGLKNKLRLELNTGKENIGDFKIHFVGYTQDDLDNWVSDPILNQPDIYIHKNDSQLIWIEGNLPADIDKNSIELEIEIFHQLGYDDESKIGAVNVEIEISDIVLKPLKSGDFFLDLWQHTSSWARVYDTPRWSETHWTVIQNYLTELSEVGLKTITAVVSDYPWAGQACYQVDKNASNLFEYNMVKVIKNHNGDLQCDFENLDRYIELCLSLGIESEINLFGLLGNWDAFAFGNPIDNYKDPIRINYFDEIDRVYKYIKNKTELQAYLALIFEHIQEKKWWDKTFVMCDEPNNIEVFNECVKFINEAAKNKKIRYKTAVHELSFMSEATQVDELSLSLPLVLRDSEELNTLKKAAENKNSKLTWYVCCFPEKPNHFIKSPLIESRITGPLTYFLGLDGFLRWDFAIYTNNPWQDIRYKYPKWTAGDMLFVYPGKDLKPIKSQRWENLKFGLQDYQLIKQIEKTEFFLGKIQQKLEKLFGKIENAKVPDIRTAELDSQLDFQTYDQFKIELIKILEQVKVSNG